MPKISQAGGPTDAGQPDYYAPGRSVHSPHVVETETECPGNNSSRSAERPSETTPTGKAGPRSNARTMVGPSSPDRTGHSNARSTAGPGKAGK